MVRRPDSPSMPKVLRSAGAASLALLATGAAVVALTFARPPSPAQALPPGGKVAYFGLSKNFKGVVDPGSITQHACAVEGVNVSMIQESAAVVLDLSSNAPCDELRRHFNGRLTSRWQMTLRRGNVFFGTHQGEWQLRDAAGAVIAKGEMEGTVGCGTHRLPNLSSCERCRAPLHFEGTLKGQFTGGPLFQKYGADAQVRASYAGKFGGQFPQVKTPVGSLDGVLVLPCP